MESVSWLPPFFDGFWTGAWAKAAGLKKKKPDCLRLAVRLSSERPAPIRRKKRRPVTFRPILADSLALSFKFVAGCMAEVKQNQAPLSNLAWKRGRNQVRFHINASRREGTHGS
jgi:hypothetical protein